MRIMARDRIRSAKSLGLRIPVDRQVRHPEHSRRPRSSPGPAQHAGRGEQWAGGQPAKQAESWKRPVLAEFVRLYVVRRALHPTENRGYLASRKFRRLPAVEESASSGRRCVLTRKSHGIKAGALRQLE